MLRVSFCFGRGRHFKDRQSRRRLLGPFLLFGIVYAIGMRGAWSHQIDNRSGKLGSQTTTPMIQIPKRPLQPPFPNGPCGGTVVTIPPDLTYGVHSKRGGNTFVLPPRPIQVWLPPTLPTAAADDTSNGIDVEDLRGGAKTMMERPRMKTMTTTGSSQSTLGENHHDGRCLRPVLYCHDGQNAMEDESSWTGSSWRMMGALTRLADRGLLRTVLPIVVLMPCATNDLLPGLKWRHLEYGGVGPMADAHCTFVTDTVKPLIDSLFPTRPDESYCIGSSLGGNASLLLVLRYPHLFAGAACISPAFQLPTLLPQVLSDPIRLRRKRIYLDIGGDVGDAKVPLVDLEDHATSRHWWNPGYFWLDTQLRPSVMVMRRVLAETTEADLCYREIPGGRHNERAWSRRIHLPLLHLLGRDGRGRLHP